MVTCLAGGLLHKIMVSLVNLPVAYKLPFIHIYVSNNYYDYSSCLDNVFRMHKAQRREPSYFIALWFKYTVKLTAMQLNRKLFPVNPIWGEIYWIDATKFKDAWHPMIVSTPIYFFKIKNTKRIALGTFCCRIWICVCFVIKQIEFNNFVWAR